MVDKFLMFLTLAARWNFEIADFDLAFRGFFKKIDAAQHCAFSRSTSPDDTNHLALMDVEINSFQHVQVMERLMKVCEFDDWSLHR